MSARARLYIEELPVHELLSAATYEPQQTPEVKAPCLWRFDHGPVAVPAVAGDSCT